MKAIVVIIASVMWSLAAPAKSFWNALAEIESGGNDYAVGDVGEISRYQIRPEVWEYYSSSKRYSDPRVALNIAEKYMAKLKRDFERATGRPTTEADCVILWKSGITGYEKRGFNPARMSAAHHDRVVRFKNLRGEEPVLVRAVAPKPTAPVSVTNAVPPTPAIDLSVLENFFITKLDKESAAAGKTSTNASMGLFSSVEPQANQRVTLFLR